jgi:hypothetical protein
MIAADVCIDDGLGFAIGDHAAADPTLWDARAGGRREVMGVWPRGGRAAGPQPRQRV